MIFPESFSIRNPSSDHVYRYYSVYSLQSASVDKTLDRSVSPLHKDSDYRIRNRQNSSNVTKEMFSEVNSFEFTIFSLRMPAAILFSFLYLEIFQFFFLRK